MREAGGTAGDIRRLGAVRRLVHAEAVTGFGEKGVSSRPHECGIDIVAWNVKKCRIHRVLEGMKQRPRVALLQGMFVPSDTDFLISHSYSCPRRKFR